MEIFQLTTYVVVKRSVKGIELLRELVNDGYRIFSISQAKEKARQLNIKEKYVVELLHLLKKNEWIRPLKRGLYAITDESGFGSPPHDYEVATSLVVLSAISHWTAMYYHHLTQQIPQTIFVSTVTGTSIPRTLPKGDYQFIQIQKAHFFGMKKEWFGDARVLVTDPERTLIDGLLMPQYCGGIREVLGAFEMRGDSLDLGKIVSYAGKFPAAIAQRLGWVLERLGYGEEELLPVRSLISSGIRKLDAASAATGPINRSWKIQENL